MTERAKLYQRRLQSSYGNVMTRSLMVVLSAALIASSACSRDARVASSTTVPAESRRVTPSYDRSGRLQKLEYDRDGNGRIDTWGYMDGARVVRVEVDENGDGRVDRWEYHSVANSEATTSGLAPAGVDRTVERIDRATRFDGTVSRQEFFSEGMLVRIEEDTDADGTIDKWETYEAGFLTSMALDTSGRGVPDKRLFYGSDGALIRVEVDPDGTGTFAPLKP